MLKSLSNPLFVLSRGQVPEVVVYGASVYRNVDDNLDNEQSFQVVTRDLLKPWQFIASDVQGEDDFWALGLSSHAGEALHMEALEKLSKAAEAGESELFCPRGYPFDWETSTRLKLSGENPTRLHHPCSGKHLVMIAACRKHDYPVDSYWDVNHPLQKKILGLLGREASEQISWLTDNCGLPTAVMSSRAQLSLWQKLAYAEDEFSVGLKDLWTRNPMLVGGRRRLDSSLVELTGGKVLAKEGGGGLFVMQSLPIEGEEPAGLLIKLASGYHYEHLALAIWAALSQQKKLPAGFQQIADFLKDQLSDLVPNHFTIHLPNSFGT